MLRLYIDGHLVNLSEDVRTDYYRRNPFFTNDGDYTLDLDIDLGDPVNAQIYHHGYRFDRVRRSSRRTAILMDETTVLMQGTEVVLDIHDNKAKIQIVAGVSALNYAIGDRRLRELDLWQMYDNSEGVFFPVCAYNDSEHANYGMMDSARTVPDESDRTTVVKWVIANSFRGTWDPSGIIPLNMNVLQPYMWAVIERVIEALGFAMGDNVVKTDTRYSRMVMVHAVRSNFIAETLPDWTVKQFFEEVQKFFNVIFVTDAATNQVSLVHAWDFFGEGMVEIPHGDIINVKKDFDQSSDLTMIDYTAVHYAFTDKTPNKYAAIPKNLMNLATSIPAVAVSGGRAYDTNYYAGIWKAITGDESFLSKTSIPSSVTDVYENRRVYTMTINGEERQFVLWTVEDDYCALKMVNTFSAKESDRNDVTDVELKIVPVRMASSPLNGSNGSWWQYPLPAVDGEASSYHGGKFGGDSLSEEEPEGFNDEIKSGQEKKDDVNRADILFVAFYFGPVDVAWEDPDNDAPSGRKLAIASPDWQVQLHRMRGAPGSDHFWKCSRQVHLGSTPLTMAINGTNGMDAYTYSKNPHVDTSVAYTIMFRCHRLPDVRRIFLIGNRKFYCKEIKCDISAARRSELAEGIFYPLVNDTASDGGEAMYYVAYQLTHVIVDHRVTSVMQGEGLDLTLSASQGGSASWTVNALVMMGGVDVTSSVFTSLGRTGTIHIGEVTGDIHIRAWYGSTD